MSWSFSEVRSPPAINVRNERIHIALGGVLEALSVEALLDGEVLECGEALHLVLAADGAVRLLSAVHLSDVDAARVLLGELVPHGRQLLAVAAPGRVEFHEPAVAVVGEVLLAIVDELVEVLVGQDDGLGSERHC